MMQNFGLEDLSHVQSRRNVRVEMASDWFTRIYRSILAEESRYGVQTRLRATSFPGSLILPPGNEVGLRALLEPAITGNFT